MDTKLVDWVMSHVRDWKDHRDTNYEEKWKSYERIWRGVWDGQDRTRDSERSRVISPATQQAIESHSSEIEEALWGAGANLFDIEDDMADQNKQDIEYIKKYMQECFRKNKLRKNVSDVILLASIYGTGVGEILTKEKTELVPASEPIEGMGAVAIGTVEKTKISVELRPISPRNFLIDPTATTIEEALGVAIEEFVGAHTIAKAVQEGFYKDTKMGAESAPDKDLEASSVDEDFDKDKIKLIRYYGLVPKYLLEASEDGEVEPLFKEDEDDGELINSYDDMVEAIVVIANEGDLLKAELSPYMMKDRPVVAYQDDTVPGRFWGRGIAEKGYNMQMAIDAELRSHLDSLALTTVPMMAMDATRLPRGAKFEVRPGKNILTNGNPAEILMPFKFGNTDTANIETANAFERLLLQATGTLDTALMQTQPVGGDLSIALSGIIKKNKRTLVNFQESFLIPFIEKAAWRFMQFDAEHFPVKDWKFVPTGTLGMLAREVEQLQFINLMKTIGADNPLMPILMQGVIEGSALPNKQQLLQQLAAAQQPNPEQQQKEQMALQIQLETAKATIAGLQAEAGKTQAETQQIMVDTQLAPQVAQAKLVTALSTNIKKGEGDDVEFERRSKIAELMFKERDLDLKERNMDQDLLIVSKQMQNSLDKSEKV
jgi:hypothetical protein